MKLPILEIDKPNKNGRIYSRVLIERELERIRNDYINENRWIVGSKRSETSIFNLLDAIGIVKEVEIKDDTVFVDIEIFSNVSNGAIIKESLENGKLHIRTHGLGSLQLQENGTYLVGKDFELISCFVTDEPA